ncbi:MAG: Na/Pi symporter [Phycisphaerae bacterium]|nr:Na/Pi symporter [Phycisphaerae bacterium]
MKAKLNVFVKIVLIVFFLYLFLVSIGLMGKAFKGFGAGFAENLISTTSNPFIGLFIGLLATSLIQSSSTTTSIVVGMVGSGVLTVGNAVPIIMGANIGTTVTNTLVSLGHFTRRDEFRRAVSAATVHDFFNLICVAIMFPLELATGILQKIATRMSSAFADFGGIKFTSPINIVTQPVIDFIKHLLIDFSGLSKNIAYILMLVLSIMILFFCLYFIVKLMKALVVKKVEAVLDDVLRKNAMIGIIGGVVFTAIIQSSSVTTSLLVPLVAAGVITVETAFPITIGANIGTTGTAILASFASAAATGNVSAIVIAFVHFLFNLTGAIFIYPIKTFRRVPIGLAKSLGDLASRKRGYAIAYVLGLFFVVPSLLIIISKYLK